MSNKKVIVIVIVIVIVLISLSFGIGYLVAKNANPAPIVIEKCSETK